jgi:hypothetical protein
MKTNRRLEVIEARIFLSPSDTPHDYVAHSPIFKAATVTRRVAAALPADYPLAAV